MATFKRSLAGAHDLGPVAMTPSSISNRDLMIVEAMLADIAPQWSVELHGVCVEDVSLIVLPEDGEDSLGPSFTVSREDYGLRLDQIHWDELTELGIFPTLSEVVDVIAHVLRDFSSFRIPPSVTIH
jgi:hypothetical protein